MRFACHMQPTYQLASLPITILNGETFLITANFFLQSYLSNFDHEPQPFPSQNNLSYTQHDTQLIIIIIILQQNVHSMSQQCVIGIPTNMKFFYPKGWVVVCKQSEGTIKGIRIIHTAIYVTGPAEIDHLIAKIANIQRVCCIIT